MTDKPILFSGPMVRALLDGRKTQTRRILKISGHRTFSEFGPSDTQGYDWHFRDSEMRWHDLTLFDLEARLPHQIGDRLWVRETWSDVNIGGAPGLAYRSNSDIQSLMDFDDFLLQDDSFNYDDPRLRFGKKQEPLPFADWHSDLLCGVEGRWRTCIHMPRWASRLTLVVTDVRVQRLRDISSNDCLAEGVDVDQNILSAISAAHSEKHRRDEYHRAHTEPFRTLWNSINGPAAWYANPWVTATTFTVHRCNIDQMEAQHA